jgi:hypothetical protein
MSKGEKKCKTKLVSIFGSIIQIENEINDRRRKIICFTYMLPSMLKGGIVEIIDFILSLMAT